MAYDDLNPKVSVTISGNELSASALEFVTGVTVDLALDKADLITLTVANPIKDVLGETRTSELLWTNSLAWMPGNIIEVSFSYGDAAPDVIWGGVVKKWMPRFPNGGMPTIVIKAMDGSVLMMDGPKSTDARTFDEGVTLSDMAMITVGDYGFDVSAMEFVDAEPVYNTIKKAGMTDYAFVRGIASLLGMEFYVAWDAENKQWRGVMWPPQANEVYKKRFVWGPDFEQGDGDGNLLEFYPEFATQSASTDVEVYYYDRDSLTWEKVIYPDADPDRDDDKPKFEWKGDDTDVASDLAAVGDADTARGIRIAAGGVSVEVVPAHGFASAEEAYTFAKAWWNARAALLIQGKGKLIGVPFLQPGQVHELGGLGTGLDGDWYFSEVTHKYARGGTYVTDFVARKVIP